MNDEHTGFMDRCREEAAEVPAGGLSIHHRLIPHRSLHNRTKRPRRGLAMHFMAAKVADPEMLKIPPEGATPVPRRARTETAA